MNQRTSGGERVAVLGEDLRQVVGEVATGQVEAQDGVGQRVAFVDGHGVAHAVARVQHEAGGAAAGVERQHGLDRHVHGRRFELFEHNLERRHKNSR